MQHRNSVRLAALEDAHRRERTAKIDAISRYMGAHMTPAENAAFCDALQRNIFDGDAAEYTEEELAACERFDELATARPDIWHMIEALQDKRGYG